MEARPCLSQTTDQLRSIHHAADPLGDGERLQVREEIDVQVRIDVRSLLVRGGALMHGPILAMATAPGNPSRCPWPAEGDFGSSAKVIALGPPG